MAKLWYRRKFEIEKLNVEDIEMEDLNFYYANYSRYVCIVLVWRKADLDPVYITTSSRCEKARRSCWSHSISSFLQILTLACSGQNCRSRTRYHNPSRYPYSKNSSRRRSTRRKIYRDRCRKPERLEWVARFVQRERRLTTLPQMPRKEIMKQIGSLFILRINWGGSILDSPVRPSLLLLNIADAASRRNCSGHTRIWNRYTKPQEAT